MPICVGNDNRLRDTKFGYTLSRFDLNPSRSLRLTKREFDELVVWPVRPAQGNMYAEQIVNKSYIKTRKRLESDLSIGTFSYSPKVIAFRHLLLPLTIPLWHILAVAVLPSRFLGNSISPVPDDEGLVTNPWKESSKCFHGKTPRDSRIETLNGGHCCHSSDTFVHKEHPNSY